LGCRSIYASPHTRAVETALLACEGHPHFKGGGPLKLTRFAREVKSTPFGSMDCVGAKSGPEIAPHVQRCLQQDAPEFLKADPEALATLTAPVVDPRGCTGAWWTPLHLADSKESVSARANDLWLTLRHDPRVLSRREMDATDGVTDGGASTDGGGGVIVVGHSLFFKRLVKMGLSPEFRKQDPMFCEQADKYKLENAACLKLEVEWQAGAENVMRPPVISKAELVFGSTFHAQARPER